MTFFQANHSINDRNQLYFISVFIYTCIKVKLTKGRKRDSFAKTKPNYIYRSFSFDCKILMSTFCF